MIDRAEGSAAIVTSDTTVAHVTFFEDRAEVVRVARCRIPRGRSRVHARGITLLVDDRSLTCAIAAGPSEIVFSRVRRSVEDEAQASSEQITALDAELARARARLARGRRALDAASADGHRASGMMNVWADTVAAVPSRADAAARELGEAYDALETATRENLDAFGRLRAEVEDATTDHERAELRLRQARASKPRYEAFAEIEMVSAAEAEIEITLTYRTPCALWRPEHLARLRRVGDPAAREGRAEVVVTTYASVWQLTGESWKDVPCRFSTARPARSAIAPLLREDVLATRRKSDNERRQVVVEARDQVIATAGVARGTRDVDEMPGVEDGGEAQWLTARSPATIPSDGLAVRVEVGERTMSCALARVCFPELGPATHLRANGTLAGRGPLLAGPVTIGRETEIVGRGVATFTAAGEPFERGFGLDDGLRVRRHVVEKRKTTPVIGTQHVAREVALYVSNLSGDPRVITLIERVPVSEVEEIVIEVEPHPEMRRDARDGFLTFELDVPPRATRELVFRYRIEAKSNVVLP